MDSGRTLKTPAKALKMAPSEHGTRSVGSELEEYSSFLRIHLQPQRARGGGRNQKTK